jgi:hypothetical protein
VECKIENCRKDIDKALATSSRIAINRVTPGMSKKLKSSCNMNSQMTDAQRQEALDSA